MISDFGYLNAYCILLLFICQEIFHILLEQWFLAGNGSCWNWCIMPRFNCNRSSLIVDRIYMRLVKQGFKFNCYWFGRVSFVRSFVHLFGVLDWNLKFAYQTITTPTNDQKCAKIWLNIKVLMDIIPNIAPHRTAYTHKERENDKIAAGWSNICFKDVLQAPNRPISQWCCLHMSSDGERVLCHSHFGKVLSKCSEAENHREQKRNVWGKNPQWECVCVLFWDNNSNSYSCCIFIMHTPHQLN